MHIFVVRCQCRMFHKYFNFEIIEMVFVLASSPPTPLPLSLYFTVPVRWSVVILKLNRTEKKNNLDIPRKPVTVGDSSCLLQPISMCQNVFEAKPRHREDTINIPLFSPVKNLQFLSEEEFFWQKMCGPSPVLSSSQCPPPPPLLLIPSGRRMLLLDDV